MTDKDNEIKTTNTGNQGQTVTESAAQRHVFDRSQPEGEYTDSTGAAGSLRQTTAPIQTGLILNSIISRCDHHHSSLPIYHDSLIDKKCVSVAIADPMKLNWTDRNELMSQASILSETQCDLLNLLERKQRDFAKGFDKGNYFTNALPIICSDVKFAQRFVCCGRPSGASTVFCEKPMFCSRCARNNGNTALAMYHSAFEKGTFHFVTISFKGHVSFDSLNCDPLLNHWKAVNAAFSHLQHQDKIDGAYWVDELAIHQFIPLRIIPHGHAIVDAAAFTQEHIDEIKQFIRDQHPEIDLEVSVDVQRIPTRHDFIRVIRYCNKAMDLTGPYETAAAYMKSSKRDLQPLNREMRELLEGVPVTILGKKKIHRCGSMLPQCKSRFIGSGVKQRKRSLKNALLMESKIEDERNAVL